jgi:PAS domain S-box-containing protein
MPLTPKPGHKEISDARCKQIALAAACVPIGIGLSVLAGWWFDVRALMTVLPGFVAMKPNTAIALCGSGLCLLLFLRPGTAAPQRRRRRCSLGLAGGVALLGALTLVEYASGFNLGIDELLFADYVGGSANYMPGRMAPITATNFIVLGVALAFLHFPEKRRWAQALTIIVALTSLLATIGYFFGVARLYQSGNFTAVALHTAIAFFALCIGVWCATSSYGFMKVIMGSGASGMLVRRYGLAAVVLPFFYGWLRLQGERHGFYGTEMGSALVAIANGVTFAALIWIGARSLRAAEWKQAQVQEGLLEAHLDLEDRVLQRTMDLAAANIGLQVQISKRAQAEEARRETEAGFHMMANNISQLAWIADPDGAITWYNDRWFDYSGTTLEEMAGRGWEKVHHPDHVERVVEKITRCFQHGEVWDDTFPLRGRDGEYRWFLSRAVPIRDAEGTVSRWFGTHTDVTENKLLEADLAVARDQALESARLKSEFLANMSHEIRTPMNGIIGMTELVLETELDREQRNYLGMAHSSALSLLGLINDILDFSKIEAGKLELEAVSFSLRECISTALKPLGIRAGKKELDLSAEILPEVPDHLIGDPTRLRQVLINLADNAIKFTERGEVMLRVAVESHMDETHLLHFTVRDTGVGIPPDKQSAIFEAFAQADGSTTRHYGGTGLGLAIVSQIVQHMGGRIWVESVMGEGATFHFTAEVGVGLLPIQPPQLNGNGAGKSEPQKEEKCLRILLAEDNVINCALATGILRKRGHALVHAANGREALEAASAAIFDLIFMDVQMPEMDGFEATRHIREMEQASGRERTPIVAMTAHAMTGDRERCLAAGMDDYLSKPLVRAELTALLAKIVGKSSTGLQPAEQPARRQDTQVPHRRGACAPVSSHEELLDQLDGDEALLQRMVALFQSNTPRLMADLNATIAQKNRAELARAAHALLSSFGAFGARRAYQLGRQLEESAPDQEFAHLEAAFGALEEETKWVSAALDELTCAWV